VARIALGAKSEKGARSAESEKSETGVKREF
jgi:hypothetical protein